MVQINRADKGTSMKIGSRYAPLIRPRGFALVATISIMVLLTVLTLGLVSLSTVALRSGSNQKAQREARANARLAMTLAIGELQKYTGKDQRVTAEADILSDDGFAGFEASEEKSHYVGAYSTEEWHDRGGSRLRGNLRKHDDDRNKRAFQRWLTSGDSESVRSLDFVKAPLADSESVVVVGEGTVGDGNPGDVVRVPKDGVEDGQGRISGRIGWWVGDEGVKAKVNLGSARADANSSWDQRFSNANPVYAGISNVAGLENVEVDEIDAGEMERVLSPAQLRLVDGRSIGDDALKARYHDVTTYSQGVLADVALGGLKRDLSIPFELPNLKPSGGGDWNYQLNQSDSLAKRDSDFTSIWEFSNSGDQNPGWSSVYWPSNYRPDWWANKLGYCFMLPDPSGGSDSEGSARFLRGPTWQSLRNHYRSYKREYENLSAREVERRGWRNPSDDRTWLVQPYQPYSHWHNSQGRHLLGTTYVGKKDGADKEFSSDVFDPFYNFGNNRGRSWNSLGHDSLGRAPVFTKIALVLSHQSHPYGSGRRLELVLDAVGTIWNPYNAPIEFESVFTNIELTGLKWNFTRRTGASNEELAVDPQHRQFGREKQFPFQFFRLGVTSETDHEYPFSQRRPRRLIRLNPGECRTFALNFNEPQPYQWADMVSIPGSFTNNWDGGMRLRFTNRWQVNSGETYQFELIPQAGGKLSMESYLGYFQETAGGRKNPFQANQQGTGYKDLPELESVHVSDASDILDARYRGVLRKRLSNFTNDKEAICYLEFRRRAADDSPQGVLAQFDPRSIVNHSDSMGPSGKGSVPGNWDVKLNSVSDFDLMQAGIGGRNNGFWGSSHEGDGETHVVAFEIPDAPITNLAGLQHCQTGANGWDVSYAIGNSLPHPKVPLGDLFAQEGSSNPEYRTTYYDMSYLANQGLWDRYFFSGVHLGENASDELQVMEKTMTDYLDPSKPNPLANKRLVLAPSVGEESDDRVQELTHYRWIARQLMLDGAANINSTRVEAWKAWLGSLKDEGVEQVDSAGGLSTDSGQGTPFFRHSVVGGDDGEAWRGYVRLSDSQIESLAENIVEEVKKRGPFLSVSDFVNRRLTSDDTGKMGALQAALENSGLDTGSGSELGIPGTIRQADVLNSLGGVISARSDTFVIRAYGESVDPEAGGSGRVLARAWCEVVVQRVPTLLDDNGELLKMPNPDYPMNDPAGLDAYVDNEMVSEVARTFGREYKVLSFRWLAPEEV